MRKFDSMLEIQNKKIGIKYPAYFIADIASNHDGDLERAKDLIFLAAESGADAAKFQHFQAESIVSDYGFRALSGKTSHQKRWKKSVFETYQDASINLEWTPILRETCDKAGIAFFTSPYSFELVDHIDPYVPAYKIGSGDITWHELIEFIARKNKPLILATGASTMAEVKDAVSIALASNTQLALLQCNTNYTGSLENLKYINLNVIKSYQKNFPGMIVGLSDHTPGDSTVLGAISLGAKIIEKHFTDNAKRSGPDHEFSMDPKTWSDMVCRAREVEQALGGIVKKIEDNESQTAVLQRRSIRVNKSILAGHKLTRQDVSILRPCPEDAIAPYLLSEVLGRVVCEDMKAGEYLKWSDLI